MKTEMKRQTLNGGRDGGSEKTEGGGVVRESPNEGGRWW